MQTTSPAPSLVPARQKPSVNLIPVGYDARFRTTAMVIQAEGQRPRFCHVAGTSLPPACGGPVIVGWSWKNLRAESFSGTRWGSFVLVGTFDGRTFTLTEPAVANDKTAERPPVFSDLTTPCPKPAGGWRPVDPDKATNTAFEAATALAEAESGFGQIWIDQQTEKGRAGTNNPRRFILNVATTGDVVALERRLREVWGGSLCVSKVARTQAQLYAVQAALNDLPGLVSNWSDIRSGQVVVDLRVATSEKQRELDDRFGQGTVRLQGVLVPID